MAKKRMFSIYVIDSDAFLDMPLSTQALYFHLAMRADDDGFIGNPKRIQRIVGASDDDLKLLIIKRFLIVFDDGVVVIKHWRMHNTIQSDRYTKTVYTDEMAQLHMKENKSYTLVGKVQTEKIEPPKPKNEGKHKYGEFKHVLLTDKQYESLKEKYKESLDEHIRILDEYCETSGKTYKNYALVIQGWVHEKYEKNKPQEQVKLDEKFYAPKIEKTDEEVHEDFEKIRKELFG